MKSNLLKVFGLIFISLALVILCFFYQIGLGINRTVLNYEYYDGLINKENITSKIYDVIADEMPNIILAAMTEEMNDEAEEISEEDKQEAIEGINIVVGAFSKTFDKEWFEEQALLVIDDSLNLIKGNQNSFEAVINLEDRKEKLRTNLEEDFKKSFEELKVGIEDGEDHFVSMVDEMLEDMDLPDKVNLDDLLIEQGIKGEILQFASNVQLYRGYFNYIPYIFFAFILSLFYLFTGFSNGLKWFGVSFLFSSASFMAFILLTKNIFISDIVVDISNEIPLGSDIISTFINFSLNKIYIIPTIIAITGVVFFTAGYFINKIKNKE